MTSQRVRDMAAAGALTGTELFYADDGASNVQVTANQIRTFVGLNGLYIDIRDFDLTIVDGGDITVGLQGAIDYIGTHFINQSDTPGGPSILVPFMGWGGFTCGNINFHPTSMEITVLFDTPAVFLNPGVAWILDGGVSLRGICHSFSGAQQKDGKCWIRGDSSLSVPTITINAPGIVLENMRITNAAPQPALLITEASAPGPVALIEFRNCAFLGSPGLQVDCSFWVWLNDCQFQRDGSYPYSVEFLTTSNALQTIGLIKSINMMVTGGGILFQPTVSAINNMHFEHLQAESLPAGASLLNFDSTNNVIYDLVFYDPQVFDSTAYYVKNIGNQTTNISFLHRQKESDLIDPTSDAIKYLTDEGQNVYGILNTGTAPLDPSWMNYVSLWPDAYDITLLSAPRGPQQVFATPIDTILQDPTTWQATADGDMTVATGILAPDGSLQAGTPSGTTGFIYFYDNFSFSVSAGDWFVFGVWIRSTDITKPPLQAIADMHLWSVSAAGAIIGSVDNDNGGGHDKLFLGGFLGPTSVRDAAWKWTISAGKIVAVGTGDLHVSFKVPPGSPITSYYNPCAFYIPAGSGFSDAEILAATRSFKGGWSSAASAGDVGILDHQKFKIGGGARLFSSTASPVGSAAGQVGDIIWNKTPSVGQPKGWQCTVAGAPATWVSMGNL